MLQKRYFGIDKYFSRKLLSCYNLKMPRKVKIAPEIIEAPVELSKKTGKPKKKLTELQLETLRKGRELAVEKRKAMVEGINLNKRAELLKLAKEEKREAKNIIQNKALKDAKENYIKQVEVEDENKKPSKSKNTKKIIKYIEESSSDSDSDSSVGEVIIKKKKKQVKKSELIEKSSVDILKQQLDSEREASLNDFMKPSYF